MQDLYINSKTSQSVQLIINIINHLPCCCKYILCKTNLSNNLLMNYLFDDVFSLNLYCVTSPTGWSEPRFSEVGAFSYITWESESLASCMVSLGCLINQELSFSTCQYGSSLWVEWWWARMWTPVKLWGRIDGGKVIIRLWMLVSLWVKGGPESSNACCHWPKPSLPPPSAFFRLPHTPIPTDPRSVQKAGLNPVWPFHWPVCRGVRREF